MGFFANLTAVFRVGQFDGKHKHVFDIHSKNDVCCEFTYHAIEDKWDVNFVGFNWDGKDIWNELSVTEYRFLQHRINSLTDDWRRSVGVTKRRFYSNIY